MALPLPPNAQDIELQDGEIGGVYRLSGEIVYDTRPVPPGESSRQIFVRYRLPFDSDSAEMTFPVPYEIGHLNLLVADLPGLAVDVSLADDERATSSQETIQGSCSAAGAPPSPRTPMYGWLCAG